MNKQTRKQTDRPTHRGLSTLTHGASTKTSGLFESEAFSILQRDHQFLLEYFATAVGRQYELIKARM